MSGHVDFDFICSHTVPLGHGLPDWDNGGPYKGRATAAFIEEIHGPLRSGETLHSAFHLDVAKSAKAAAEAKLKAANGVYDPPMIVDAANAPTV